MKQITGEKFTENIEKDPSWCLTLTELLEITTYVNCWKSNITHLSPLLHFTGKIFDGSTASFNSCKNLKEACGTFSHHVDFSHSGVEKTKKLKVIGVNDNFWSADFLNCKSLKVLEGEYEGAVRLSNSSIEQIKATVKTFSLMLVDGTPQKMLFGIDGCQNLFPNENFLMGGYIMDDEFKKKCEKKMRENLSRLPNIAG